ncbi:hypothetical protein BU26DRAFT_20416 [Trematosphaeria pertusa]|uniref:Uncharacterized protein n=1 Tax=Trematosphaeria pertusa TaxID=390896 RepID=A0A6A6J390_9PLEO|nr:uncharacterized protein BU26DRAFT_20416 [Trematosphaeria pertusa]KAF2256370.1 hypothetical protein BU26DRAFT_20416 [Trematosphaeria pertusa]
MNPIQYSPVRSPQQNRTAPSAPTSPSPSHQPLPLNHLNLQHSPDHMPPNSSHLQPVLFSPPTVSPRTSPPSCGLSNPSNACPHSHHIDYDRSTLWPFSRRIFISTMDISTSLRASFQPTMHSIKALRDPLTLPSPTPATAAPLARYAASAKFFLHLRA